jgi:GDP-L-fucose synthase
MKKNSKIYVAGHTGLVGSALVKSLKAKGYTNIIGKTLEELDLRNPMSVKTFFEWEKPEYVILAAAKVGGIVANSTYRADFIYENLMIQNNVIHQSYLSGVKKLLFLGSTCIYPKECPQPMKEEYLLTSPLEYTNEPYAIAKIAGIKMCESYNIQYGTNFISVMPTNLYGPNDNFNLETSHVLPALIRKIHLGKCLEGNDWDEIRKDLNKRPIEGVSGNESKEDILSVLSKYGIALAEPKAKSQKPKASVEIWGSGKPMREFLWSEDMADACVYIIENIDFVDLVKLSAKTLKTPVAENCSTIEDIKKENVEIRNTHINIGIGEDISIKNLAEIVKEKLGFKGELYFNSNKPDGTLRKLTDVTKLHNLGWKHKIEIRDGVEKLHEWYCNNIIE